MQPILRRTDLGGDPHRPSKQAWGRLGKKFQDPQHPEIGLEAGCECPLAMRTPYPMESDYSHSGCPRQDSACLGLGEALKCVKNLGNTIWRLFHSDFMSSVTGGSHLV